MATIIIQTTAVGFYSMHQVIIIPYSLKFVLHLFIYYFLFCVYMCIDIHLYGAQWRSENNLWVLSYHVCVQDQTQIIRINRKHPLPTEPLFIPFYDHVVISL